MAVEVVNYALFFILPFDILYPELADGSRYCWFRYVMWAMTCPILLQQILRVLTEDTPSLNFTSKLMASNILMDLMGATAAMYSNLAMKVSALLIAFVCFFGMMYALVTVWFANRHKFKDASSRSRRDALVGMLSSWTIFPVLFLLGPAVSGVLTYHESSALHALGDLLSKNLVGFASWQLRNSYRKKVNKNKEKEMQYSKKVPSIPELEAFKLNLSRTRQSTEVSNNKASTPYTSSISPNGSFEPANATRYWQPHLTTHFSPNASYATANASHNSFSTGQPMMQMREMVSLSQVAQTSAPPLPELRKSIQNMPQILTQTPPSATQSLGALSSYGNFAPVQNTSELLPKDPTTPRSTSRAISFVV